MKNKIENIFKEKFDRFETTPSAGLFDAIQAKRAKKKRAIWLWAGAALLVCVGSLATISLSHTKQDLAVESQNTTSIYDRVDIPQESKQPKEVDNSDKSMMSAVENENDGTSAIKKSSQKRQNLDVEGPQESNYTPLANRNLKSIKGVIEQPPKSDQGQGNKSKDWASLFANITANGKLNDKDKATLYLGNKQKTVDKDFDISTFQNGSDEKTEKQKNLSLDVPQKSEPNTSDEQNNTDPNTEGANSPLPTSKLVALSKWRIQASAGLGYASRVIQASDADYISARNGTESPQLSNQINLIGIYQFSPKWNVQTGLNFTQRKEMMSHSETVYTIEMKEVSYQEVVIHPVLGTIERTYTETIPDTTAVVTNATSTINTFTSYNVPLVAERLLVNKNDWNLLAKAGVLVSINNVQNGQLLKPNNTLTNYANLPSRSLGVNNLLFGLGAQYRITPRVSILAYPQGYVQLNSALRDNTEFSQKDWGIFTNIALRIGL
jgi:hypothetical protein